MLPLTAGVKADETAPPPPLDLGGAVAAAEARSPRLAKALAAVDAARGKSFQSTLRPNPVVEISGDELGDRTGAAGTWSAPRIQQEFVAGRKRSLNVAAADREVAKAELGVVSERMSLGGDVRARFIDAVAAVKRMEILSAAVNSLEESATATRRREAARESARLDVIIVESVVERYKAELDAAQVEAVHAVERLALLVGAENVRGRPLEFPWDETLPDVTAVSVGELIRAEHPDAKLAQVEMQRSRILLDRARVEPLPNLTIATGYIRQTQNRSNDWFLGVSAPLPAWDRNQGNIQAARAGVAQAAHDAARIQDELADKALVVLNDYLAARERATRLAATVLPRVLETHSLSAKAYQAGRLETDRILETQRATFDVRLELLKARADAWKAWVLLTSLVPIPPQ